MGRKGESKGEGGGKGRWKCGRKEGEREKKKEGRELEKMWPTVKENWQWMLEPTSARCHRSDVARCHSSRTLLHWDSAYPRGERSVCVRVCSQSQCKRHQWVETVSSNFLWEETSTKLVVDDT